MTPWAGNANRYVHPVGLRPGFGGILLKRGYLNNIAAAKQYPLVFTATPANAPLETQTFKNLRIVGTPIAITPGVRDDEDTTFFIELADRRIDCVGLCGKRYNWRIMPDTSYETASTNGGSAWTWTTLITDLWNAVGNLGTFPGLAVTPAGTPEQIDGMGCRAADLLEDLLLLNCMGVKYNPSDDVFTIVSFAANADGFFGQTLVDASLQAVGSALSEADDKRLWDQEPLSKLPKLPKYARVVFPVWSAGGTPIDTASYYVVDVADTTTDSTRLNSTSYALVQDFIPCRTNQVGTVLNSSNLVTRAADVAANFFKVARRGSFAPINRTYTGIGQGTVVRPGAALDVLVWEDVGAGPKTHVIQTGRLGFGPMFTSGSVNTSGALLTGHPFGSATNLYRVPLGSTDQANPIQRVSNTPPGELRLYNQGPMAQASGNTAVNLAGGGGESSLLKRTGPLRQWDAAVQARSVDGNGQRLWLAKPRTQHMCIVKVTSASASGIYYPAVEQLIQPITGDVTAGDVCWFYDPNLVVPAANSYHLCYLDGTDGSNVKVYIGGPGGAGNATDIKVKATVGDTTAGYLWGLTTPKMAEGAGIDFTILNPGGNEQIEIASTGLTVEDDDSNPTYPNTFTLRFDQDDGFVLSQPAANIAKVDFNVCTALQALAGYNGSVVQVLGHDASGVCTWYSVEECP